MKKLFFILVLLFMNSCVYDPPRPFFSIYNYSDGAVYYYLIFGKSDSLPEKPGLTLFYNSELYVKDRLGNKIFGPIGQTGKRIDAYDISKERLSGKENDPHFPNGIKEITLFFITEKTMRDYDWKQIHNKQLYESKVIITENELKNNCWRYTYIPSDTLKIAN